MVKNTEMKLKQDLIEKLRNGEIVVENDGDLYTLRGILREAFPYHTVIPIGAHSFYYGEDGRWAYTDENDGNLCAYCADEFIEEEKPLITADYIKNLWKLSPEERDKLLYGKKTEFKNGDSVEYNWENKSWECAVYIGKYPSGKSLHVIKELTGKILVVDEIRHEIEDKETILERIKDQIGLASVETDLNIRHDYLQQALIDIKKL